ncbi:MAG: hypothetical protein Pars92KO_18960 [Parasphingorhabdus sp.]|jgi:hypothetical protein
MVGGGVGVAGAWVNARASIISEKLNPITYLCAIRLRIRKPFISLAPKL